MKDYGQAENELLAEIRLDPRLGVAYYYLSLTFEDMGETSLAAESMKKSPWTWL